MVAATETNSVSFSSKCGRTDDPTGSMKAVLPGKPESRPQALSTGYWDSRRITVSLHPGLEISIPSSVICPY